MSISATFALLIAAQGAPATTKPAPKIDDADPVVCQRIEETGSRISARKVCMRKSQWAEQRSDDRMLIDRSQIVGCKQGTGC